MNQTYLIEPIERLKSNQCSVFISKRDEIKNRLFQMKKRTKQMLEKHDWEKFISENGSLMSSNQSSSTIYTETSDVVSSLNIFANKTNSNLTESKLNLFNTSKSVINHLDYDSLLLTTNNISTSSKFQIKLMPLLHNTETNNNINSNKMFQTPKSFQSFVKQSDNEDDYQLSLPKYEYTINKKRCLTRQQESLTFIADLASTSTPTKNGQEPITSTPKKSTHNPLKYHPTQTIRNKQQKKQTDKIKQRKDLKVYKLNIDNLKYDLKLVQSKAKKSQRSSTHKKSLKRKLSTESLGSNESFNSDQCQNCNLCNLSELNAINQAKKQVKQVAQESKKRKLKIKGSNIEFSLADLLYTPSKLNKIESTPISKFNTNAFCNNINQLTNKPTSKVYFL